MHVDGKGNILQLASAEYVGIRSFGRFARLLYSHISQYSQSLSGSSLISTIAKTASQLR